MNSSLRITTLIAVVLLLAGCSVRENERSYAQPAKRFAWITGLKPEMAAYYRDLHASPWPGVVRTLKECNIKNYSIYLREIEGKFYLFSYLEYTGNNWENDVKKMAADPETQRWWKETDPCQLPLPDAAEAGKIWADAEEVFYLP